MPRMGATTNQYVADVDGLGGLEFATLTSTLVALPFGLGPFLRRHD